MPNEETTTITETAADGSEINVEIIAEPAADDAAMTDQIVEALFDGEAADTDVIYADIDGDGKVDAGGTDTDGDGSIDTIVADMDGDGKLDATGLDTDGDGKIDEITSDSDGDGVVDAAGNDTDGDGNIDTIMFDSDGDGEMDVTMADEDGDGQFEDVSATDQGLPTDDEISTNSIEFTVGDDMFPAEDAAIADDNVQFDGAVGEAPFEPVGFADTGYAAPDITADPYTSSVDTAQADADNEAAAQQAHSDAASEAQASADDFVERGDYAAAADAREVAEHEADAAGDTSMLGSSDSSDLDNAAYKQGLADDYQAQQAEHIAEGDYEAAKEDAQNAGYETRDADSLAGGADHTGQSDNDEYNLDWAAYQDSNAEQAGKDADYYAAQGDFDKAEIYADRADEYDDSAADFADQGDPTSINNDFDPSAVVETGGSYDAGVGIDTGFDDGVDMTPDISPMDDGMDYNM